MSHFALADSRRARRPLPPLQVDYTGDTFNCRWGHAPWNHPTLADYVMPSFLWIVGVSLVLSFRAKPGAGHKATLVREALGRTARLFLLGFLVQVRYPC